MPCAKRRFLACFVFLAFCASLAAADKTPPPPKEMPKSVAGPKDKEKPSPAATPKEILIMSVHLGKHWLLSRMLPDGTCKEFLNQTQGFSTTVPTNNQGDDFDPATSINGKHLAFYSNRSGAVNLWLADPSGRFQKNITQEDTSVAEIGELPDTPIQFSLDSKKLIFLNHGNLWIFNLKSEELSSLSSEGGIEAFALSPDGKWIAYYRKGSLRRVACSGQPDELLATNAANCPTLAFGLDPKKNELFYFYKGLWSINTFTKEKNFLVGSLKYPNRIRINPQSGDAVSFIGLSPDLRAEAYLLFPNKKGSGSSRFTTTLLTQGGASNPFFSADGKTLYFQRAERLWSISTTGDKVRQLQALACLMPSLGFLDPTSLPECAKP
jgi:Tol biopolymer transport system component